MKREDIVAAGARREIPSYARIDLVAVRGEGAWILDADGTRYLDLYGGHAVALLGHAPPRVADAIAMQARDLLFYSNVVHLPARARAAERLARLAPWPDAKVFFTNSGAEANETALKIARKTTGRTNVVAFRGGFHGRTLGALAACGMDKYRAPAAPLVPSGFAFAELNGPPDANDGAPKRGRCSSSTRCRRRRRARAAGSPASGGTSSPTSSRRRRASPRGSRRASSSPPRPWPTP